MLLLFGWRKIQHYLTVLLLFLLNFCSIYSTRVVLGLLVILEKAPLILLEQLWYVESRVMMHGTNLFLRQKMKNYRSWCADHHQQHLVQQHQKEQQGARQ